MGLFNSKKRADESNKNTTPKKTYSNAISLAEWFGSKGKGRLFNDTSEVDIQPEHLYRGYGYGIIRSVVNTGIIAAEENVRTTCSSLQREILAKNDDQIRHPYITLWQNSPFFSEYDFWKEFLLYIQLKGEFFIYMNRKKLAGQDRYRPLTKNLCSPTSYMKIINPYEMSPNKYDDEGNVIEWLRTIKNPHGKDLQQVFPAYQIIHITEHNPWQTSEPYSLLDATKENLYTLENARDFTRHALVNNINAPGMIAVNGNFETQEDFENYVANLKNHNEGEVIVAAGDAETTYQDMNQNLDGASQEKIRSLERDEMLVTAGASKSILGIETAGLTRDVAATQKLTFVERTVIPYIKLMLETLNYDYRVMYAGDFLIDKYILRVTIPSVGDKAQEEKELELREQEYTMVQKFVDRGYTRKSAAQYVRGEIDVEQLQLANGDKVKLSPEESVALVDSAQKWQGLISSGNDPQSVIDLVNGTITMAEFLEINKDVEVKTQPEQEPQTDPTEEEPESTGDEPIQYDPDPEDFSTPRDLKEGAEDTSNTINTIIKNSGDVYPSPFTPNDFPFAQNLYTYFSTAYSDAKGEIAFNELKGEANNIQEALEMLPNVSKNVRLKIQKMADNLDYAKINSEVIEKINKLKK